MYVYVMNIRLCTLNVAACPALSDPGIRPAPDLPTNIADFRGFDSSVNLIIRADIPRPVGDFPESLTQAMLVGVMLVGRLGVLLSLVKQRHNRQQSTLSAVIAADAARIGNDATAVPA